MARCRRARRAEDVSIDASIPIQRRRAKKTNFVIACLLAFLLAPSTDGQAIVKPTTWHDARELTVEGRGWSDTAGFYDRLPAKAEKLVRPEVWKLSQNSAGISARFITDADSISVRWKLRSPNLSLPNMTAIAVSGVDLYVKNNGRWRWAGSGRPDKPTLNEQKIIANMAPQPREFLLYLPLYNGVDSVEIGVPEGATVSAGKPGKPKARPLVFYGTSIVQGASASRPGMAYPSVLGRNLDVRVVNLGFSGNGRMESEVADLLGEIDAGIFIIDCLPNLSTGAQVTERTPKVVEILRKKQPGVPIVLVGNIQYPDTIIETGKNRIVREKNVALKAVYKRLISAGVRNVYYIPARDLIGSDGEATIDGVHPTDLGFMRIAGKFEPLLQKILRLPEHSERNGR